MLAVWLANAATAGCVAWSADDETRLATSGLVVTGTVRDLDVDGATVRQHVEVARAWKGHVRSGWLTLVTGLFGGSCPGDRIYAVGTEVFVIGDPDANGEVPVSPCVPSTGEVGGSTARLAGLAARRPSTAGRFVGSAPPAEHGPATAFPTVTGDRARVVRVGVLDLGGERHAGDGRTVVLEGDVVARTDGRIRAIWDTDDLRLVGWVDAADVEDVPIRTVPLADGVVVAPGTSLALRGDAAIYDVAGVHVSGTVPADAIGQVWRPAPVDGVAATLSILRDVGWAAVPGGPGVGSLALDGAFAMSRAGDAVSGWVPVRIGAPGLLADGWLPEDAVVDGSGGLVGGVSGGISDGSPTVELPAGTEISALDADVVFARTTHPVTVRWLSESGDRVWIVVPTPWGPIGGMIVR